MKSWRTRAAILLVTTLVAVTAGPSMAESSSEQPRPDTTRAARTVNLDLLASAHPVRSGERRDLAVQHRARWGRSLAKVDTAAVASAVCDGCHGHSVALHTVFLANPRTAVARNVATAWSSCSTCEASALSVQIVVLRRSFAVKAVNRALASNVACESCRTSAAAYQLVLLSDTGGPLSQKQREELLAWVKERASELRAGGMEGSARARRREMTQELPLDDLARVVTDDELDRVLDKDLAVSVR